MVQKRRRELKGTSVDRNDGSETFLLYEEESRSWTATSLESWFHSFRQR